MNTEVRATTSCSHPSPTPMKKGEYQIVYMVREGDTLSAICDFFNHDLRTVVAHNHISNPDLIHPGEMIFMDGLLILDATNAKAAKKD